VAQPARSTPATKSIPMSFNTELPFQSISYDSPFC
jgi:hypothetical protein